MQKKQLSAQTNFSQTSLEQPSALAHAQSRLSVSLARNASEIAEAQRQARAWLQMSERRAA